MSHSRQSLTDLSRQHDFLICSASAGTAFDEMEIKHKECFIPAFIQVYHLQAVAKYARECWEFVNLYSIDRGCNRFLGIIKTFQLLAERPEAQARGFQLPDIASLIEWTKVETKLGNPALREAIERTGDGVLKQALDYSLTVNAAIEKIARDLPPFPYVRESLQKGMLLADQVVVSAMPQEDVQREWTEHGLATYVSVLAGQEAGTKKEQIKLAMSDRYDPERVIMIGDALGDLEAAHANGILFYPINPGHEDDSWQRFHDEAFAKFFAGTFAGAYQQDLIAEFMTYLPISAPWERA